MVEIIIGTMEGKRATRVTLFLQDTSGFRRGRSPTGSREHFTLDDRLLDSAALN